MIQIAKDGRPFLLGGPFDFERRPLFGLEVGEAISVIGEPAKSGKQTSACRRTEFIKPVIYRGLYTGPGGTENTIYAAFQIDSGLVKGWNLFHQPQPIYEVWAVSEVGKELFLQNFRTNSILIHKAIFSK